VESRKEKRVVRDWSIWREWAWFVVGRRDFIVFTKTAHETLFSSNYKTAFAKLKLLKFPSSLKSLISSKYASETTNFSAHYPPSVPLIFILPNPSISYS
jgi:hypothetical protein